MSLTKLTKEVDNISALSDYPNSTEGLSSQDLKERFDKASVDIKDYINSTLTDELDTIHANYEETLATKEEVDLDYLKKTDAEATYETIENVDAYKDEVDETYLKKTDASSIYLTQEDASEDYLTKQEASTTYDTISNVANIYATKQALAEAQMGAIVDQSVTKEKLSLDLQETLDDLAEDVSNIVDIVPSDASTTNQLVTNDDLETTKNDLETEISNIGDNLAVVATTGSYNDLINKPFIPVVPTNVAVLKIYNDELANDILKITNTLDTSKVYEYAFNGNGELFVELEPSNYDLYYEERYQTYKLVWSANVTLTGGIETTAVLQEERVEYEILGFDIDETISTPSSRVTYTDGMLQYINQGHNAEWVFNNTWLKDIKPCRLSSTGEVSCYLKKDNFNEDVDGHAQTLTSGDNVMIEFPKIYWYMYKEGNIVHCKISDSKIDENYKCLAHLRGDEERDKIYIGAYLGYNNSGTLKSWSGKSPTTNQTSSNFRGYAQANGTNYQKMTWYMYLMLEILFVLKYKTTDCQTAIGKGYTKTSNSSKKNTGGTETRGMDWGEQNGTDHCKFLGIEDAWGNVYQFIDGLYTDGYTIKTTQGNFADFNGSNITSTSSGLSSNTSGYVTKIQGTTETGFLIKKNSGSETTHYCDCGYLASSCLPIVGGHLADGGYAGLFCVFVNDSSSDSLGYLGSRIAYL